MTVSARLASIINNTYLTWSKRISKYVRFAGNEINIIITSVQYIIHTEIRSRLSADILNNESRSTVSYYFNDGIKQKNTITCEKEIYVSVSEMAILNCAINTPTVSAASCGLN